MAALLSREGEDTAGSNPAEPAEPSRSLALDSVFGYNLQSMTKHQKTSSPFSWLQLTPFLSVMNRPNEIQELSDRERNPVKQKRFTSQTNSYNMKNPTGELFTYTAGGKVRTSSD